MSHVLGLDRDVDRLRLQLTSGLRPSEPENQKLFPTSLYFHQWIFFN
jgi:hypothetical protein